MGKASDDALRSDSMAQYCRNLRILAACSHMGVSGPAKSQIACIKSYPGLWVEGPSFETWWLDDGAATAKEVAGG